MMRIEKQKKQEFLKFAIVGALAAGIHYAVYFWLQHYAKVNIAYTIGYMVSLVCNFYLTAHFTFRSKANAKKAVGFGVSHLINYILHLLLFNVFLFLGVHRLLAPVFVLLIVVPINFLLIRFVFSSKQFNN